MLKCHCGKSVVVSNLGVHSTYCVDHTTTVENLPPRDLRLTTRVINRITEIYTNYTIKSINMKNLQQGGVIYIKRKYTNSPTAQRCVELLINLYNSLMALSRFIIQIIPAMRWLAYVIIGAYIINVVHSIILIFAASNWLISSIL